LITAWHTQKKIRRAPCVTLALAGAAITIMSAAGCGSPATSNGSSAGQSAQQSAGSTTSGVSITQFATTAQVKAAVTGAERLTRLPSQDVPQLEALADGKLNYGYEGDNVGSLCPGPSTFQSRVNISNCTFGDKTASKTMVLLGDSRAQMWFQTIDQIATASRWRLIVLAKAACPAAIGSFRLIDNNGVASSAPSTACDDWHRFMISAVKVIKPQLIVDSSAPNLYLMGNQYSAAPAQVETAMRKFLGALPRGAKKVLLGGFPNPVPSPDFCLSKDPGTIQNCAFRPTARQLALNAAARAAAARDGAGYIDEQLWLCAASCPSVIAGIVPYTIDGFHIESEFATYLTGALWAALKPYLS
jgi:hypothetical protein